MTPQQQLSRTGARVRFMIDNLGLIGRGETVGAGDTGTVLGPAPERGWILVEPDRFPQSVCPVHLTMIEELPGHSVKVPE